jgi:hypothetical protein
MIAGMCGSPRGIETKCADFDHRLRSNAWPAQQGAKPGSQFLHVHGLDDIIVRPGIEPEHPVFQRGPSGLHDRRRHLTIAPTRGKPCDSVPIGQAPVENDCIVSGARHGIVRIR